ncbi:MAG: site-specific DNA-methyltransferase [Candidatus Heimdallarchaeota archaeon]|nr:MAG: site-specific DNA-methyltransferase [Candidatus Heimdallarchaeota archaeon]
MKIRNKIICGDCISEMMNLPSNIIDLAFADPPYNLNKDYGVYADSNSPIDYLEWTEKWLSEILRLLKPGGSFYLLNLPKWAIHHAVFLDQFLYRQNTIAWDALSTPRGKIMPAHYSLLYYTKSRTYTFNQLTSKHNWTHCARSKCIQERTTSNLPDKPFSDIWTNIYRVKHRKKRHVDHPTQLPLNFMERIILTSSNKGDLIFDPFLGVGTTAIAAKLLKRDYLGIEINPEYVQESQKNLKQISLFQSRLEFQNQQHPLNLDNFL